MGFNLKVDGLDICESKCPFFEPARMDVESTLGTIESFYYCQNIDLCRQAIEKHINLKTERKIYDPPSTKLRRIACEEYNIKEDGLRTEDILKRIKEFEAKE